MVKMKTVQRIILALGIAAWTAVGSVQTTAGAQSGRPVVIEEFSGTWCPTSYAAELALDELRSEYTRDQLLVVSYHLQDAFSIPFCDTQSSLYNITNYPTAWFDGYTNRVGGNDQSQGQAGVDTVYTIYKWAIDGEQTRIAGQTPFTCSLAGNVGPSNPTMSLTVSSTTGYPNPVNVIFLITEDGIPVSTSIGLTQISSVCRGYLGTKPLTMTSPGSATISASYSGTIPYVNASQLKPVVLIQDTQTREVVGAVGVFDGALASPTPSPTPTLTPSPTPSPTPTPTATSTKKGKGSGGGSGGGGGGGGKGHNK